MSLLFSQSQITVNGNSGGAVSPMSYYQRPFSPSAYSLPGSLNSSIIMQHGRSLGESLDSPDFHDNFNTTSTNHTGRYQSNFSKKEQETFNTPLFNDPLLGEESRAEDSTPEDMGIQGSQDDGCFSL